MANYPMYQPGVYGPHPMYGPYMGQPMPQPPVQQPMQQPVQPMQNNAAGGIVCAPVTSREEAVATRVEAFGPSYIMPDIGHGMVYFKRFNEKTALADFEEYKKVIQEEAPEQPQQPVIDIASIIGAFQGRFDTMERKVDALADALAKPVAKAAPAKSGTRR